VTGPTVRPRLLPARLAGVTIVLLVLAGCTGIQPKPSSDQRRAAEVNAELGINYLQNDELVQAQIALDRAMQFDPDVALAHLGMASLRERQGSDDLALKHYREALRLEPANPYAQTNLGDMLCRRGELEEGQALLGQASANRSFPLRSLALFNSGMCYLRAGDTAQAEDRIREALREDPTYARALFQMAVLTFEQGRPFQTRAFLSRLDGLGVATPQSLKLCYESELLLGNPADAQRCAERLMREFGESDEAAELRSRGHIGG
jgi:type IV pilus assembly protein PilF